MNCYDVPQYWDLAFADDTQLEADFVIGAVEKYCSFPAKTVYEPGCGGGRLVVELASRGLKVTGVDSSQTAVSYAAQQLDSRGLSAQLYCGDMTRFEVSDPVDVAFCFVNTFRHMLTEEAAADHLKSVARSLRGGGLYLLGLHLFPPDADTEDSEQWNATDGDTQVDMRLDVADCNRATRQEILKFQMTVTSPKSQMPQTYRSDYRMRLYEADQMKILLAKISEFELLDVYDFWYDLSEPLELNNELGDTVLVLQKR